MNTQEKTETRDRDGNRERARKLGTCNTYHTRTSNQKTCNIKTQITKMGNYENCTHLF